LSDHRFIVDIPLIAEHTIHVALAQPEGLPHDYRVVHVVFRHLRNLNTGECGETFCRARASASGEGDDGPSYGGGVMLDEILQGANVREGERRERCREQTLIRADPCKPVAAKMRMVRGPFEVPVSEEAMFSQVGRANSR
jgi:hypothetical protein